MNVLVISCIGLSAVNIWLTPSSSHRVRKRPSNFFERAWASFFLFVCLLKYGKNPHLVQSEIKAHNYLTDNVSVQCGSGGNVPVAYYCYRNGRVSRLLIPRTKLEMFRQMSPPPNKIRHNVVEIYYLIWFYHPMSIICFLMLWSNNHIDWIEISFHSREINWEFFERSILNEPYF